eukprot:14361620-Alexandrium_andersonii.AAC.1
MPMINTCNPNDSWQVTLGLGQVSVAAVALSKRGGFKTARAATLHACAQPALAQRLGAALQLATIGKQAEEAHAIALVTTATTLMTQ